MYGIVSDLEECFVICMYYCISLISAFIRAQHYLLITQAGLQFKRNSLMESINVYYLYCVRASVLKLITNIL